MIEIVNTLPAQATEESWPRCWRPHCRCAPSGLRRTSAESAFWDWRCYSHIFKGSSRELFLTLRTLSSRLLHSSIGPSVDFLWLLTNQLLLTIVMIRFSPVDHDHVMIGHLLTWLVTSWPWLCHDWSPVDHHHIMLCYLLTDGAGHPVLGSSEGRRHTSTQILGIVGITDLCREMMIFWNTRLSYDRKKLGQGIMHHRRFQ